MKKLTLLLIAGGMMALASCSSNNSQNASQAQIDSMVNVKTGEMQATMQAKNDSTINALAKAKADSITAAKGTTTKEVIRVEERRDHHEGHYDHGNDQNYNNQPPPPNSVTNRPGATNATNGNGYVPPKSVNDRPGATNNR